MSSYLIYPRSPFCCGPLGNHGPISYEIYARSGAAIPIGGGIFGEALNTGWEIQGGARVLFFNTDATAAWVADLSISNVNFNATGARTVTFQNITFSPGTGQAPTTLPTVTGTVSGLDETYANIAIGREYYLWGHAKSGETNWRWGFDVGGRVGTAKVDFNEFRHFNGTVGGMFVSLHSDFEYPCKRSIIFFGIRGEYSYTWSQELLQHQNNADLQTLNFLAECGFRF
jgi:hypothetical protein